MVPRKISLFRVEIPSPLAHSRVLYLLAVLWYFGTIIKRIILSLRGAIPPWRENDAAISFARLLRFARNDIEFMERFYSVIFIIVLAAAGFLKAGQYAAEHGSVIIDDVKVKVEIADEASEMARGLSNRKSLDKNHGMIFVFVEPGQPAFWMKDMEFPIDIIWIKNDVVVDIAPNLPVVAAEFLSTYSPREPANYVLEVNAGFAKENGIKVGDKVDIKI